MKNQTAHQSDMNSHNLAIDYLRSSLILLVVFLHSVLAYTPWGGYDFSNYIKSTSPIIDVRTVTSLALTAPLINGFVMSLMYFISGLFAWKSYSTKGFVEFLKKRLIRLGLPFFFMFIVVNPLAYYPSYLVTGGEANFFSFWVSFSWTSGPAWFLSLLLFFDLVVAILFRITQESLLCGVAEFLSRPYCLFWTLIIFSIPFYMPIMAVSGPYQWLHWGAFTVGQTSRLGLYMIYFTAGALVGCRPSSLAILFNIAPFSIRWCVGLLLTLFSAFSLIYSLGIVKTDLVGPWTKPYGWQLLGLSQVFYSAILSIACLALFTTLVHNRHIWADSLCANSFCIYIVHYPFVIWAQYYSLHLSIPAEAKAISVFIVSIILSWGASELLRGFYKRSTIVLGLSL